MEITTKPILSGAIPHSFKLIIVNAQFLNKRK